MRLSVGLIHSVLSSELAQNTLELLVVARTIYASLSFLHSVTYRVEDGEKVGLGLGEAGLCSSNASVGLVICVIVHGVGEGWR
jgi:hypothetical protein